LSIASFETGEFWETVKGKNVLYPHLYLESPRCTTIRGINTYDIAFSILDRTIEGGANGMVIVNACQEIAQSVFRLIYQDYFEKSCPLKADNHNTLAIQNAFADGVYGVRIDGIKFISPRRLTSCTLPTI
jgi:hypothetical protein